MSKSGNEMDEVLAEGRWQVGSIAKAALDTAARFWFVVAVTGQWIFVYYIAAFYGGAVLRGDPAAWTQVLPEGLIAGDVVGNLALSAHLLLAAVITLGGPLQLIPQVRNRFPVFHHWNGRVYLLTAFIASISGIYMVWARGTVGGLSQHLSITLNGILILAFGAMAVRYAIARDIRTHRRWALRLFMVVSGVWFFRVGLFAWLIGNGGPVGFDPKTFTGPFLTFLSPASYLLPLATLEIYLRAKDGGSAGVRLTTAVALFALTGIMGLGIFGATMGLWLPHM
jgi:hypothetical protein